MYVYKVLNGVSTRLITHGAVFEGSGEVVVVIPGSPGIPEFYEEFAFELYKNSALPVCVVGYAGHDDISSEIYTADQLKSNTNLFNLEGQLNHKLDFINNFINKNRKIHFVGHSLGAWLLLELLHKTNDLIERISSIHLLFPTLQTLAQTKNGKYIQNIVRTFHPLALLVFQAAQLLPNILRICGIWLYLKLNSMPSHYIERVSTYLNPEVQNKQLMLAYESLDTVNELNRVAFDKVKHLTSVVYSSEDGWVPMEQIEGLKEFKPHSKFIEVNVEHAFVLKSSELVAKVVAELINTKKLDLFFKLDSV